MRLGNTVTLVSLDFFFGETLVTKCRDCLPVHLKGLQKKLQCATRSHFCSDSRAYGRLRQNGNSAVGAGGPIKMRASFQLCIFDGHFGTREGDTFCSFRGDKSTLPDFFWCPRYVQTKISKVFLCFEASKNV